MTLYERCNHAPNEAREVSRKHELKDEKKYKLQH